MDSVTDQDSRISHSLKDHITKWGLRIVSFVVLLAAWQWYGSKPEMFAVAPPSQVVPALYEALSSGELLRAASGTENVMSPLALEMYLSDFGHRYAEGLPGSDTTRGTHTSTRSRSGSRRCFSGISAASWPIPALSQARWPTGRSSLASRSRGTRSQRSRSRTGPTSARPSSGRWGFGG